MNKPRSYFTATSDPDVVKRLTEGYVNDQNGWVNSVSECVPSELAKRKGKKVVGWKKCGWYDKRLKKRQHALVELEIAPNTPRIQPRNHKCRAASAKVLAIYECEPGKVKYNYWKMTGRKLRMARSHHDEEFVYRVGKRVKPLPRYDQEFNYGVWKARKKRVIGSDKFVRDHRECAVGIHFFLDQKTAQGYAL